MMGCFSWCLIDTRNELVMGQPFQVLIPEQFGGGTIITTYEDYGNFHYEGNMYDLYEIVAAWNRTDIAIDEHGLVVCSKQTDKNRNLGINIACYDEEIAKLEFPLRLASITNTKTYEEYDGMFSIGAPSQGWDAETAYPEKLFYKSHY